MVRVKKGDQQRTIAVNRTDAPPPGDPFPGVLDAKQLGRLSMTQQALYYGSLSQRMRPAPRALVPLALEVSSGRRAHRGGDRRDGSSSPDRFEARRFGSVQGDPRPPGDPSFRCRS